MSENELTIDGVVGYKIRKFSDAVEKGLVSLDLRDLTYSDYADYNPNESHETWLNKRQAFNNACEEYQRSIKLIMANHDPLACAVLMDSLRMEENDLRNQGKDEEAKKILAKINFITAIQYRD